MTDRNAAERRRNRAMGDWIRSGISAPDQPLEVPARLDEQDEPDAAAGASPAQPGTVRVPSVDGGAGTGGNRTPRLRSMNDLIRGMMSSAPPGRRDR